MRTGPSLTSSWRKTQRGRVVYERKPHFVTLRDVARFAAKCQSFYVKPEKRAQTIYELSFFIRALIQYYATVSLDEATKDIIGNEASNVLVDSVRFLWKIGGRTWDKIWAALIEFFKPAPKK